MVHSISSVLADYPQAVEYVLAVDVVVEFPHAVVALIAVGKRGDEALGIRRIAREQIACARRCGRYGTRGTSGKCQAKRTHRGTFRLQGHDRVHHAVLRTSCRNGFGNTASAKRIA